MSTDKLPQSTLHRLPRYYRYARELIGTDVLRISSAELASMMDVTASQIRQDMSLLGQFGQQGYGYNVRDIYDGVGEILGMNRVWSVVIAGTNGLGAALALHPALSSRGIRLCGLFDYGAPVGEVIAGHTVEPMLKLGDFCRAEHIDIAVLCVPREQAEEACALAVGGGARGIWNLTGAELRPQRAGSDVSVLDLNFGDCLMSLCCSLNNCTHTRKQE